jgi:hypothetical protein
VTVAVDGAMLWPMTLFPESYVTSCQTVRRIITHVLGRRRHDVTGRFGLRASPDGITTPAFGDEPEVVRLAGVHLVRERGANAAVMPIGGATLRQLAVFAGADVDRPFSVGDDTIPVGDPDAPLELDPGAMHTIAGWYTFGWSVLDTVLSTLPANARPTTIQLWPEHFDAATTVLTDSGLGVNLGFCPGDGFHEHPYAYVGPFDSGVDSGVESGVDGVRGGDPAFWNAPFGAALTIGTLLASSDRFAAAADFLRTGLRHAGTAPQR